MERTSSHLSAVTKLTGLLLAPPLKQTTIARVDLMLEAFALNVLLFAAAVAAFLALLQSAREHGSLLQTGE